MITQTLYAIKNTRTGFYMPARDSTHKGATQTAFIDPKKGVPRLFKQYHHARRSLYWWLQGEYTRWVTGDGEFHDKTVRKADRRSSDHVIVEVTLTIP